MILSIIVAKSINNVIGHNNRLLWHLPGDMRFFRLKTTGHCIIMGRKTYESIGKPLPNRTNIIISSNPDFQPAGTIVVSSIQAAIDHARSTGDTEAFIIGGGEIYCRSLELCDRLYVTQVIEEFEGETIFPEIDFRDWNLVEEKYFPIDATHIYPFVIKTMDRKKCKPQQELA